MYWLQPPWLSFILLCLACSCRAESKLIGKSSTVFRWISPNLLSSLGVKSCARNGKSIRPSRSIDWYKKHPRLLLLSIVELAGMDKLLVTIDHLCKLMWGRPAFFKDNRGIQIRLRGLLGSALFAHSSWYERNDELSKLLCHTFKRILV